MAKNVPRIVRAAWCLCLLAALSTHLFGAAPGVYYGYTSQGYQTKVWVNSDGSLVTAYETGYGCYYRQVMLGSNTPCAITNESFDCVIGPGVGVCVQVNRELYGVFDTPVTLTGLFYYDEGEGPGYHCCENTLTWSACLATPSQAPILTATRSGESTVISWTVVAAKFDVVSGNLDTLRSTAGSFTASVDSCLARDFSSTSVSAPDTAGPTNAYFLLRPSDCVTSSPNGTYNSTDPEQVASRDAQINASALACAD